MTRRVLWYPRCLDKWCIIGKCLVFGSMRGMWGMRVFRWMVSCQDNIDIAAWVSALNVCWYELLKWPLEEEARAARKTRSLPVPLTYHAKRYAERTGYGCGEAPIVMMPSAPFQIYYDGIPLRQIAVGRRVALHAKLNMTHLSCRGDEIGDAYNLRADTRCGNMVCRIYGQTMGQ